MLSIPHGLHPNIAHGDYHVRELGMVSKGALDLVHRSPAHYKCWIDGALDDGETSSFAFGSGFHCALLEPARFASDYVVEPHHGDCRNKENKANRDKWRAENANKTHLSAEDMASIKCMVAAVHAHPLAGRMVRDGVPELTARWRDAETGLECKARADYYVQRHAMIVDAKSTGSASYEDFRKSVANFGYHRQSSLYSTGFSVLGAPVRHFVFLAVEKTPPYAIAIFDLDAEAIGRGHSSVREDMVTLSSCMRTGDFTGYPTSIQTLSLPPWAA